MKRLSTMFVLFGLAGCTNGEGSRCNPLRATPDCDPGLSCVSPTGPNCGVTYCCKTDPNGNITDSDPNCQPDPESALACGFDLSVPADAALMDAAPMDAGTD
jgi:hypothetical protein